MLAYSLLQNLVNFVDLDFSVAEQRMLINLDMLFFFLSFFFLPPVETYY